MIRLYLDGDVEGARELNAALIEPVSFQSSDEAPNPLPTKAVLRVQGPPRRRVPPADGPRAGLARAEGALMLADLDCGARTARRGQE